MYSTDIVRKVNDQEKPVITSRGGGGGGVFPLALPVYRQSRATKRAHHFQLAYRVPAWRLRGFLHTSEAQTDFRVAIAGGKEWREGKIFSSSGPATHPVQLISPNCHWCYSEERETGLGISFSLSSSTLAVVFNQENNGFNLLKRTHLALAWFAAACITGSTRIDQ